MEVIKLGTINSASHSKAPSIVTIGNFDGVHRGHQALISEMLQFKSQFGDAKTTLLTFNCHPITYFNPAAFEGVITGLREKSAWLQYFGVDRLAIALFNARFANLTANEFVERVLMQQLNTEHLLIGRDFVFGKERKGDLGLLQRYADKGAFTLSTIEDVVEENIRISSTQIRSLIQQGDLAKARSYLGHPITVMGRVIKGQQLGRTLGFPTANVKASSQQLIYNGVYTVRVQSNYGWTSRGVANIGMRPTVANERDKVIEVHLLDYHQDCYGECLTVELIDFIRAEQKFNDISALKQQIERDVITAKDRLAPVSNP